LVVRRQSQLSRLLKTRLVRLEEDGADGAGSLGNGIAALGLASLATVRCLFAHCDESDEFIRECCGGDGRMADECVWGVCKNA